MPLVVAHSQPTLMAVVAPELFTSEATVPENGPAWLRTSGSGSTLFQFCWGMNPAVSVGASWV